MGNSKGIIVVDLFGQPADYTTISAIAKRNHLFVIEDSAQAFGAEYQTKKTCSFGDVGTHLFLSGQAAWLLRRWWCNIL
jgi:UDP-2-acetamido-2-deoxy-ribo-hexuluronate aminotransferase